MTLNSFLKINLLRSAIVCVAYCVLSATLPAIEVPLFIQPEADGEPVSQWIIEDSSDLLKARPVLDAQQREAGWMWIELPSKLTGYIAFEYRIADNRFMQGAPVRTAPNASSHAFTFISSTDLVQTQAVGEWVEVIIQKPVPLYFNKNTEALSGIEIPKPEPIVQLESRPSLNKPVTPKVNDSSRSERVNQPPTRQHPTPSPVSARYYEGTLGEARNRVFSRAAFPFVLKNSAGDAIAYVDTQSTIVLGTLPDLIDKRVLIQGIAEPFKGTPDLVIRATRIQGR